MPGVRTSAYDLWYDATGVGADLVVETWISHGPRANDPTFDPHPGDSVTVGDDEPPLDATVVRRQGDRVWIQVALPDTARTAPRHTVAS